MKEEAIWLLPILNPDIDKALTSERFSFGNDLIRKKHPAVLYCRMFVFYGLLFLTARRIEIAIRLSPIVL